MVVAWNERHEPIGVLETNNGITEHTAGDAVRRQANLLEQTHDAIFVDFPSTVAF